jgi:hypothetical protein
MNVTDSNKKYKVNFLAIFLQFLQILPINQFGLASRALREDLIIIECFKSWATQIGSRAKVQTFTTDLVDFSMK